MAASPKVQEPSMEEILASIRRIMADDEPPAPPRRAAGERPPQSRPDPDGVLRQAEAGPRQAEPRGEPMADPRAPRMPPADDARPMRSAPPRPVADSVAAGPRPRAPQPFAEELDHPHGPIPSSRPTRVPAPNGTYGPQEPARRPAPESARPDFEEPRQRPMRVAPTEEAEQMFADIYAAAQREANDVHVPPAPRRPVAAEGETPRPPRTVRQPEAEHEAHEPSTHTSSLPGATAQLREEGARRRDLLSPNVDAVVAAAFQSLGDLVLPHKERTIEDLVKEILRPMLKDWLDKNLPGIVERLVKAEIERVSRQPR